MIVNGLDEFPLSAGLLLPAQSSTAAQLLKQDRMSMQSHEARETPSSPTAPTTPMSTPTTGRW